MIILPHPLTSQPDKSEFRLLSLVNGMIHKVTMRGIVILFAVALFSCGDQKATADGQNILTREQMVTVLTEVYVAEERTNRLGLPRDSAEQVFQHISGKVFDKVGVPDSVFRKSINFYLERPLELEQIYTALVDSLNLREQRANVQRANSTKADDLSK
jgi:hypothetical protein